MKKEETKHKAGERESINVRADYEIFKGFGHIRMSKGRMTKIKSGSYVKARRT